MLQCQLKCQLKCLILIKCKNFFKNKEICYSVKLDVCSVTHSLRNIYFTYFGVKLGDLDRPWDPYKVSYVLAYGI